VSIAAILPVAAAALAAPAPTPIHAAPYPYNGSFSDLLIDGAQATADKMAQADQLVRAFVLDDSIPVHQVTYAIEQARLSLELMVQVRTRLLEGYQQLMNMQI